MGDTLHRKKCVINELSTLPELQGGGTRIECVGYLYRASPPVGLGAAWKC
jgi:hypothetical protein